VCNWCDDPHLARELRAALLLEPGQDGALVIIAGRLVLQAEEQLQSMPVTQIA
jgi:hypothetical protein